MINTRYYVVENSQGINQFFSFIYKNETEKNRLSEKASKKFRFKFFLDSEEGIAFVDENSEMIDALYFHTDGQMRFKGDFKEER